MTKMHTHYGRFLLILVISLFGLSSHACPENALVAEITNDTLVETKSYFPDGTLKTCIRSYHDKDGVAYKEVVEYYRKNGSRRSVTVTDYGIQPVFKGRYAKNDAVISETYYTYNFNHVLIQKETRKNGQCKVQVFDTDAEGNAIESN